MVTTCERFADHDHAAGAHFPGVEETARERHHIKRGEEIGGYHGGHELLRRARRDDGGFGELVFGERDESSALLAPVAIIWTRYGIEVAALLILGGHFHDPIRVTVGERA